VPQELLDSAAYGSHVPAAVQQPIGHEVALHTHCPDVVSHVCPDEQPTHATPLLPQDEIDSFASLSQLEPVQQPPHPMKAHEHVPLLQLSCVAHAPHTAPPVPHSEFDWAEVDTHVVPSQHPLGHEDPLQTHAPAPLHVWPFAHAAQLAPPVPQEPADSAP
jgi:hypothetical protein